ncbi:aldehyde dehydrogenase family protein [Aquihabitans sp. McL0605]|uniref:aldehyde dehydrogenase family protein n=1 Tax=Aquihabitans sp. McL0605 TaxID=3415671 RepID=UPI003CFAD0DD
MSDVQQYDKLYIDGSWVQPDGTGTIDVINASTEEVMGSIPEGSAADVDRAVAAAVKAFPAWSATSPNDRAKYVQAISEGIAARNEEIAATICGEVGMPMFLSQLIQAGLPQAISGSFPSIVDDFVWEETVGNSLVVMEPLGVVGAITPWNYPLHQIILKVAPALAAGNTVVLKPSEVAPLNAFILAEIIDEIGLPDGVFNLVSGTGQVVGEAISAHPQIDMVSFTGSTNAGKRVAAVGAATVKRVALELGGKSANILLPSLEGDELVKAAKAAVGSAYLNSGQTCSALTRLLVPADKHDEIVEVLREEVESTYTIGDPATGAGRLGPLISATQRDRVRGYIQKGIDEGATLVTGGPEQPEDLPTGYYVKPTVFAGVRNDMTIAQEEIFGPVLSVIPYQSVDEAVEIANDSPYGLSGGVWGADADEAKAVARRIRTGGVEVNGGGYNPLAPFGGYKQSGNGREAGKYGLEEFLQAKAMHL